MKTVDCITMCTNEYVRVSEQLANDRIVVGVMSDSIYEEFVLIVHRTSSIERLSDLRGRKMGLHMSRRTALAPLWLETLLAREGLGPSAEFFGQIVSPIKITKAVLPVFFRQMDTCLVTRNGFDTMVELNPQVGQELKTLAVSPAFVPVAFFFRSDYSSPLRAKIMGEITRWHINAAGRQILTIFQVDRLEEHPLSCLESAIELVTAHQRLSQETKKAAAGKTTGSAAGR